MRKDITKGGIRVWEKNGWNENRNSDDIPKIFNIASGEAYPRSHILLLLLSVLVAWNTWERGG